MIKVGDKLWLQHGPFRALWEVIEIKEAGAVLAWVAGWIEFTGYNSTETAPDGTVLTTDPAHAWLGKAHWSAHPPVTGVAFTADDHAEAAALIRDRLHAELGPPSVSQPTSE